jgi:hypothetical protein
MNHGDLRGVLEVLLRASSARSGRGERVAVGRESSSLGQPSTAGRGLQLAVRLVMTVHSISFSKLLLPFLGLGAGIGFAFLRRRARHAPPTPRLPVRAPLAPPRPRRVRKVEPRALEGVPPAAFWDASLHLDESDDPAEIAADSRSMISEASRSAAAGPDDEEGRGIHW